MDSIIKSIIKCSKNFFRFFPFGVFDSRMSKKESHRHKADVIIYGGTSATIIAAVEAIQSGKSVIMVSPDIHLGGLSSGGLGWTDTGRKETIGGLARNFYHRIYEHYQKDDAWKWMKKEEYGNRGQGAPAMTARSVRCGFLSLMWLRVFLKINC